eukprot:CAMPEP_0184704588 /NCGR_PEP_ID=MMETSP0313-20130426/31703_1 /TAXON_ID=2792 /ORGANISM="Porphyridium aerugineum, Strain SAG 1380-2" /LENGTH=393 /DNA_ID=CAMNT_0027165685 /DNA_START=23 /DNA_END=1200 /DNA_ORIENTATION=-
MKPAIGLSHQQELLSLSRYDHPPWLMVSSSTAFPQVESNQDQASSKLDSSPNQNHGSFVKARRSDQGFIGACEQLRLRISEMENFLQKETSNYLSVEDSSLSASAPKLSSSSSSAASSSASMSNQRAMQLENSTRDFIEECVRQLDELKYAATSAVTNPSSKMAKKESPMYIMLAMSCIRVVSAELNGLSTLYKRLRAVRLRKTAEHEENKRRAENVKDTDGNPLGVSSSAALYRDVSLVSASQVQDELHRSSKHSRKRDIDEPDYDAKRKNNTRTILEMIDEPQHREEESEQFSGEMIHALDAQNELLLEELRADLEVARQVEATANEVSAMSELLATKVQEQTEQISDILKMAQESNMHMNRANRELDKMHTSNIAFTKIIIFLLLFATFS